MLNLMRKHAKSWVIHVMIVAIAVTFAFWGVGSFRERTPAQAATVNGEIISIAEYDEAYRQLLEMARNQFKDQLSDELLDMLNLKGQALTRLIDERLLFQQAQNLGMGISKEEIGNDIVENPLFQVDGRFNKMRYREMLGRLGFSAGGFEDQLRKDRLNQKITGLITNMAKVSPDEVRDTFNMLRDQVDLDFVLFTPEKYRDQVKFTPEELEAFFKENQKEYSVPAKVNVSYLSFRPGDFTETTVVTDDDVADYYELHLDDYRQNEQVKARHILFRVDPNAPPEKKAEVRAKAEAVLKRAKGEEAEDFAELAKEFSEGPTAVNGGDLGWFNRDQMVKPFANAAFSLEKDQVSDLVETDFGFHIIKTEDHRPAGIRTLEEARDEIKEKLKKENAAVTAAERAEDVYDDIILSQDFEGMAQKLELTPTTTGFFALEAKPTDPNLDQQFKQVALDLEKDQIAPLLELADGFYILKALDRQESYLPELTEVQGAVEEDLAQKKALELAKKAADEFVAQAQKENGWDSLVESAGLETDSTGPFTRGQFVPKIGGDQALKDEAFALKTIGQLASRPFQGDKGYYLVRLKESIPADQEVFEQEKESLANNIRQRKGQAYLQKWLNAIKAKSIIEVEKGIM